MDFDELLDNCQNLEKTIQMLIKSNAYKQSNVNRLQAEMLKSYKSQQKELAELEQKFQIELYKIKAKSEKLELEIKQVNIVNEELREVVNRAQQATHTKPDGSKKSNETYQFMAEVIENLEKIRADYNGVLDFIRSKEAYLPEDSLKAKETLDDSKSLVIELHKNEHLIRLLEKQGKFAEQQFDLILSQIPWEPLTTSYIKQLRESSNEDVRNMADNLALQVSEIEDLEESQVAKKNKKLEILKDLTDQLDLFVRKRSEAILSSSVH